MKSMEFGKFVISELVHAIWVEIKAYLQIALSRLPDSWITCFDEI